MHPSGITTLYGESNVGKGWVACWAIRELLDEGYLPGILDYEMVPWEWMSRLYGMGIRPSHGVRLYHVDTALTEKLVESLAEALGMTTHLIVDSASAARAMVRDSDAGGQDAAMSIFRALKDLGIPCLLLAHRAKAGGAGPLGSVQYRNQSSMVLRAEAEGAMATKVWVDDVNDRPRPTTPMVFTRVPTEGGYADVMRDYHAPVTQEVVAETLEAAILKTMDRLDRSLAADDVWRELGRDDWRNAAGEAPAPDVVAATMRKLTTKGRLIKVGRGRYATPVDQLKVVK